MERENVISDSFKTDLDNMTKKNKPGQGRPSKIKSDKPLEPISTRISVEAIAILKTAENKAVYIDEAIKEKNCHNYVTIDK